jgi:hypothetical protein
MDSIRPIASGPKGAPLHPEKAGKAPAEGDGHRDHAVVKSLDSLSRNDMAGWKKILRGGRLAIKVVEALSYHSLTKDVLDSGGILKPSGLTSALHATGVASNSILGVLAARELAAGIRKKDVQKILEAGGETAQSSAMALGNAGLLLETGAAITGGKLGSLLKTAGAVSSRAGFLASGLGLFGCALSAAAGARELKEGIRNKDRKEIILGVLDTASAVASAVTFTGVASLPGSIACLTLYGLRSCVEHGDAIKAGFKKIKQAFTKHLPHKQA